jgi:DNA-binding beta-propeller fold protein YncE
MNAAVPESGHSRLSHGLNQRDRASGSGADFDDPTATGTTIATIPLGGHVHDIALTPGSGHVYVAQTDSIVVINGWHHIATS